MPSWRVHLITGALLSAVLAYACFYTGLGYLFVNQNQIQFYFVVNIGFITLLGSVFPDFDYRKTLIRHALGPVLAVFVVVSYVYLNRNNASSINPIFLTLLFVVFVFLPYILGLVLPLKHHGKLHSILASCMFCLLWLGLELLIFRMTTIQAGVIAVFGFMGYNSHLLLDLDLKWS